MKSHINFKIYIPDLIGCARHAVNFCGYGTVKERDIDIYIYVLSEDRVDLPCVLDDETQFYCEGFLTDSNVIENINAENFLILRKSEHYPEVLFLKIGGEVADLSSSHVNVLMLLYDYDTLLRSEGFSEQNFKNVYSLLSQRIKLYKTRPCIVNNSKEIVNGNKTNAPGLKYVMALCLILCKHSALCNHIKLSMEFLKWIYDDIRISRKITIKSGNMLLALFVDIILGIIFLNWINQWYSNPSDDFINVIEMIVNNLRKLLQWLMGSPAGLKLNHAFNNTLGQFFLYHIELWWMFIAVATNLLDVPLSIFRYIGIFGVTFQSAILADFLTLATLHVYCIYVYAARLYYMQVTGLIALWRLFLGKKKNPLRGGVDSCQYTHQQLFVGMLGFTILLFLVPTTALYYIVFTLFRICIVIMSGILMRIRYFVSSLPLYVLLLWLIDSPKIASNVQVTVLKSVKPSLVVLGVTFTSNPIRQLIDFYRPETICTPNPIEWVKLISNLWMGELIYPV